MIGRAARPMSTLLGRRLITFLLQLNGAGWGPGEAACEGWEKGGGEGSPHLGLDGRGQSILTQSFLQISHPLISHSISNSVWDCAQNHFILLVVVWSSLRFISDIWSRHVEACTTHLVPVCATPFCPFYPRWDCPPCPPWTLPLHLRRHRHLSTITRTHKHIHLNIN